MELARQVSDQWTMLAIDLKVDNPKIREIEADQRGVVWQGYNMLKYWWESREDNELFWFYELANAIKNLGKQELAKTIIKKGPNFRK